MSPVPDRATPQPLIRTTNLEYAQSSGNAPEDLEVPRNLKYAPESGSCSAVSLKPLVRRSQLRTLLFRRRPDLEIIPEVCAHSVVSHKCLV